MYLATVRGTVVCTIKYDGLVGRKLLLVEPQDAAGKSTGPLHVAVDTVQAGTGDHVWCVSSREAALALDPSFVPVDAAIVGIVDDVHLAKRS